MDSVSVSVVEALAARISVLESDSVASSVRVKELEGEVVRRPVRSPGRTRGR